MPNRARTLEIMNCYTIAVNEKSVGLLESLFSEDVVCSKQDQVGVSIGTNAITKRLKKIWDEYQDREAKFTAVCGLIDIADKYAFPCVALLENDKPFSVIVCEAEKDKQAHLHTELTDMALVSSVRLCCSHKNMKYAEEKSCPAGCAHKAAHVNANLA
ncbi:hypothetical protein MTBPR1_10392 [Candidatus Terasakiella magnetica]|uniref:SnoaL-like domain-containing protein n=1 Tax=Candidatus Terasakiella magnetica TaxID=1867952 RepID=A0A1C3RCZ2_9PROT|nr:hypothetical protein [Candidatus Terasakiella magnetica]SCA55145.1 hypothetical protein MTBPR1_10392 [Candidatus Terasakiella magnetica]